MDWSAFIPSLIATFAGVLLALLLEDKLVSRREAKRNQTVNEEWAQLRTQLLDDVVRQGFALEGFFALDLHHAILNEGEPEPLHVNVTWENDLWKAIGPRYSSLSKDTVEIRSFERFYRLLNDLEEHYLSPRNELAKHRRGFVIQDAIHIGRYLVQTYGSEKHKADYPKSNGLTATVEQARAEKARRANSLSKEFQK